jgi:retron-type reverse transcriptase
MDVMAALQEMFELRAGCWNLLNTANIALIAKK